MIHNKDDVLPAAAPMWVNILLQMTSLDASIFNPKKEHPCPVCGGKTRFRYRDQPAGLEAPFFCNNCGSRSGINMLMECTGLGFNEAINAVGDHLGQIPVEQMQVIKRDFEVKATFSKWYKFDIDQYQKIKNESEQVVNSWQRINGLQMINMYSYQNKASIPLINEHGKESDIALININGRWETTNGNTIIQNGLYSVFGSDKGNHTYLTVSPLVASKSHVFTGKQVLCVWEEENICDIANLFADALVIVSNKSEAEEADSLNLNQMIFDSKTNKVRKKIYLPGEIVAMRNA